MSDLDKKLAEAVCSSLSIRKAGTRETTDDAPNKIQWFRPNGGELWFFEFNKEAIKQAFIDDGWISYKPFEDTPEGKKPAWWSKTPELMTVDEYRARTASMMTGQEWYDRYIIEQNRLDLTWPVSRNELIAIGKKAAGIEV